MEVRQYGEGTLITTPKGTVTQGKVSDTPESFIDNELHALSLTPDGRLRVSSADSRVYLEMFDGDSFITKSLNFTNCSDPFGTTSGHLFFGD